MNTCMYNNVYSNKTCLSLGIGIINRTTADRSGCYSDGNKSHCVPSNLIDIEWYSTLNGRIEMEQQAELLRIKTG